MTSKPAERSRPPSVERVLAEIRRLDGDHRRDPEATLTAARNEVDAERSRLIAGSGARPIEALAALSLIHI